MTNYTTLEQSKALYAIFGDVETEKVWAQINPTMNGHWELIGNAGVKTQIPAHTLSTLLDRLPAEIKEKGVLYFLMMLKLDKDKYIVQYFSGALKKTLVLFNEGEPLLAALVNLTQWLHENKYLEGK